MDFSGVVPAVVRRVQYFSETDFAIPLAITVKGRGFVRFGEEWIEVQGSHEYITADRSYFGGGHVVVAYRWRYRNVGAETGQRSFQLPENEHVSKYFGAG
ncbi:hypothetical protein GCM10011289_30460 [Paludibacterium paludis]|uniref:Uncharacterized protein n=2 Tax=Paludibacterium paludis TaxID=1225769 RepID=A0A918P5S4_9NEIS|nr:hypothetical protein GCM10011289_30460 [Paludibacterium paludis]